MKLTLGERMSCEIIERAFGAILQSPTGSLPRGTIKDVIFRLDWAKPYLVDESGLRQLRNRIGWCLDQLKTAGLIENKNRRWQLTSYGATQVNGIVGSEVRKTVGGIEGAMKRI